MSEQNNGMQLPTKLALNKTFSSFSTDTFGNRFLTGSRNMNSTHQSQTGLSSRHEWSYGTLAPVLRILITLCLFAAAHFSVGQTIKNNFSAIDKRVKGIQSTSVDSLSKRLTQPYKTNLEKVRSIFKWITENIEYDVEGYHNPIGVYAGLFRPDISTIDSVVQQDYNDRIVAQVLTEKRALCDGYSRLFKSLCDKANIQSVIINGYIRWYSDPIGVVTDREHSWNAVFINNTWQLLDPTWASGTVDGSVTKFLKEYNDLYFLTDPRKFFNDHYPSDPKWVLFTNPPNRQQFYSYPFFYKDFYDSRITSINPVSGTINITAANRKVRIELETEEKSKALYIIEYPYQADSSNHNFTDDGLPKYKIAGRKIFLDYEIQYDKTERIDVLYNNKLVVSYRISRSR